MSCPWSHLAPATIKFCEQELCSWVTQPANTWSNIGYLVVGILLFRRAGRDQQSHLKLIGIASIVVGIGSGLFHASGAFAFEVLDLLGMFLISGLLVVYNLKRLTDLGDVMLYSIYAALTAASVASMFVWRPIGIPVFAMQLALAMTFEMLLHIRRDTIDYKYFLYMIGIFVVSFGVWYLDISGIWCNPDNHILNGHAIWHLLDAVAIYYIYLFYAQFKDAPRGRFTLEKPDGRG